MRTVGMGQTREESDRKLVQLEKENAALRQEVADLKARFSPVKSSQKGRAKEAGEDTAQ